jgi:hypothetical protein
VSAVAAEVRVEVFAGCHTTFQEDLDVLDATFACPNLTTFCRLDGLRLEVTGQRLEPDRAWSRSATAGPQPTNLCGPIGVDLAGHKDILGM